MNRRDLALIFILVAIAFAGVRYLQPGVTGLATLQTNDQSSFDEGSYSNTLFNTSGFVQLSAGQTSGTYMSRVFDVGAETSWNNITWTSTDTGALPNNGQADLMSGNLVLLHMDENQNTVIDSSGNDNDAENHGATYSGNGKLDGAWDFDGEGDYIEDEDAENYLNGLSAFTVALWVKSENDNTDKGFIIAKEPDGSDNVLGIRYDKSGSNGGCDKCIKAGITVSGEEQQLESSSNVQTTSWQFIALTWESGAQLKLYINGELDTPTANDDGVSGSIEDVTKLLVGKGAKDNNDEKGWDGLIDEVVIWNRQLSAEEVLNIYKRGVLGLDMSARSCDDAVCDGEAWTGLTSSPEVFSLDDNRYFQYKADFSTENTDYSPELYDVSIEYAPVDETAPTIGDASITPSLKSGGSATVQAEITDDNVGVDAVTLTVNASDSSEDYAMTGEGDTYSGTFTAGTVGTHYFRISANDTNGNTDTIAWQSFEVSKPGASVTKSYPIYALPGTSIVISADITATDPLIGTSATLNTPAGFTFPLPTYSQTQEISNFDAGETKTVQWFVYVPTTEGTYPLNVSFGDNYENEWESGEENIVITYDPANLTERVETLEGLVEDLQSGVETLQTSFGTLETSFTTLESIVSDINTTVENNKAEITTSMETVISDITGLESNLGTLSDTVDTNSQNITRLQGNVTQLNSDVTDISTNLNTLSANISTLYGLLDADQLNTEDLDEEITNLSATVSTISTRLDSLSTAINSLNATTTQLEGVLHVSVTSYPEIEAGNSYSAEITVKDAYNAYTDVNETPRVTLLNPSGGVSLGPTQTGVERTGTGTYTYTVETNESWTSGFWQIVANVSQAGTSYETKAYFKVTAGPFDMRDITVVDGITSGLELTAVLENLGAITKDMIIDWTLTRTDNDAVLDSGGDTIGVGPESTKTYTFNPSTSYVGEVKISLTGQYGTNFTERTSASHTFTTTVRSTSPSGGGGGGGGGGSTPTPITPTVEDEGGAALDGGGETVQEETESVTETIETTEEQVEIKDYKEKEEVASGETLEKEIIITNNGNEDMSDVILSLEGLPTGAVIIFPAKLDTIKPGETQTFRILVQADKMLAGEYNDVKYMLETDKGKHEVKSTSLIIKERATTRTMLTPLIAGASVPALILLIGVAIGLVIFAGYMTWRKFKK